MPRNATTSLAATLLLATMTAACGSTTIASNNRTENTTIAPPTTGLVVEPGHTIVAEARGATIGVFARPDAGKPRLVLRRPLPTIPVVFVVVAIRGDWLHARLPARPNGSEGWIRRDDVDLSQHAFRIRVELHAHRITVWNGDTIIDREPVGVGRAHTPTPGGVYFTKELLQPPNPNGLYGPYAYQLSGFSNVLSTFNGGDAVIGIHGTNEPWLLGKDVSHGCIRMSNAGITKLAHLLPLGVPVEIVS